MKHVGHFIAGELCPADNGSQIFNPSNGKATAIAAIGTSAEVDRAVAAARAAFPAWSSLGLQNRATVMLDLREALKSARNELIGIVVAELGKTPADAGAEVDRAIEVLVSWRRSEAGTVARSVRAYRAASTRWRFAFRSAWSRRSVRLTSRC
jgi:malonate-semialdehyde dehydrogenase (acetylating) / methylmalonate-semialdehyde dehydrogenase